jgi:hypothetical protein
MHSMKTIALATLFAASATFSAITISNVHVDSLKDTTAAYGNIWRGIVTFDVVSDSDSVYTWLEFSNDAGATWHIDKMHAVGCVGSILKGAGLKAQWMVDGDQGTSCKIRVRVNDQPKWYIRQAVTLFDTGSLTPQDCPKPIPIDDPYETIERVVNNKFEDIILSRPEYYLPCYSNYYGTVPLDISTFTVKGNDFSVGMAKTFRGVAPSYPAVVLPIRATYLKLNGQEFAVISKVCIRQTTDTTQKIRQSVQDSLGIPESHVIVNWDHTHYMDNGESLIDSTIAVVREAKANARRAQMAWTRISVGPGFNVRRIAESPAGITDGPIDDKLWGVFFKDTAGQPIGAWVRFTGHIGGALNDTIANKVAEAFGGVCQFFQGGAGTMNTWCDYMATNNPGSGRPGTWSAAVARDSLMAHVGTLTFKPVDRLGIARAHYDILTGIGPSWITAWVIGDLDLLCFTAETPTEQLLYTAAKMHNSPNALCVGYSVGGGGNYYNWGHDLTSVNDPIAWPNHTEKGIVIRDADATIRCINILNNLLEK